MEFMWVNSRGTIKITNYNYTYLGTHTQKKQEFFVHLKLYSKTFIYKLFEYLIHFKAELCT